MGGGEVTDERSLRAGAPLGVIPHLVSLIDLRPLKNELSPWELHGHGSTFQIPL